MICFICNKSRLLRGLGLRAAGLLKGKYVKFVKYFQLMCFRNQLIWVKITNSFQERNTCTCPAENLNFLISSVFNDNRKSVLNCQRGIFLFVFKARVLGILLQLCTVYPFSCLENIYSSTIYRYSIYEQKFSKNGKFVILKKKKLGSDTNNCWTMRTIAKELYEN